MVVLGEHTSSVQYKLLTIIYNLHLSTVQSCCTPNMLILATTMQPLNPYKYQITMWLCCVRKRKVAVLTQSGVCIATTCLLCPS